MAQSLLAGERCESPQQLRERAKNVPLSSSDAVSVTRLGTDIGLELGCFFFFFGLWNVNSRLNRNTLTFGLKKNPP